MFCQQIEGKVKCLRFESEVETLLVKLKPGEVLAESYAFVGHQ